MTSKLIPGNRIGSYEVVSYIGSGQFANVYSVLSKKKEPCIAKIYHEDVTAEEAERELATLKSLPKLPCFSFYIDMVQTEGNCILILPHRGISLEEMLKLKETHLISKQNCLRIGQQLVDAISELHSAGLIHRDIHSANVTVYKENINPIISIIDFGISSRDQGEATRFAKSGDLCDISTVLVECRGLKKSETIRVLENRKEKKKAAEIMGVENVWMWKFYKLTKSRDGLPPNYQAIQTWLKQQDPDCDPTSPLTYIMARDTILLD